MTSPLYDDFEYTDETAVEGGGDNTVETGEETDLNGEDVLDGLYPIPGEEGKFWDDFGSVVDAQGNALDSYGNNLPAGVHEVSPGVYIDDAGGAVDLLGQPIANAPSPTGGMSWNNVKAILASFVTDPTKRNDALGIIGVLSSLRPGANDPIPTGAWQGKVTKNAVNSAYVPDTEAPSAANGLYGRQMRVSADTAEGLPAAVLAMQQKNATNLTAQRALQPYTPAPVSTTMPVTPPPVAAPHPGFVRPGPEPVVNTNTSQQEERQQYAAGGIAGFAKGGPAKPAHYMRGETDGMADELPTTIDNDQPAALSHGEFVIPADVVSHLGNGNSDAGAKQLRNLMASVRKARTGTTKQGKEIDAPKFVAAASGGIMQGADEGLRRRGDDVPVKRYNGTTGNTVVAGGTGTTPTSSGTTSSGQLSDWAGDYVGDMLGDAWGVADTPYEAYGGQLIAGTNATQQKAFGAGLNLNTSYGGGGASTTYKPTADYVTTTVGNQYTAPANMYTGQTTDSQYTAGPTYDVNANKIAGGKRFGLEDAQHYMNPYLQMALNPQLEEARRQSNISSVADNARLTQAGAYGGSRQAILDAERDRNLQTSLSGITGTGYNTAYTNAQGQFNADENRALDVSKANLQNAQFGATYGQNDAANKAKYAMDAAQLTQQDRQKAADLGLTSAEYSARYGMQAKELEEKSKQFGADLGFKNANAAAQWGLEADRINSQNNQFGANYGIAALNAQLGIGNAEQAQEQKVLDKQYEQYLLEKQDPYNKLKFRSEMLSGMPLRAESSSPNTTTAGNTLNSLQGLASLGTLLQQLYGGASTTTTP